MREITGKTRLAGVFATPIRHSVSPMLQNKAFETLGIDAVYLAFDLGTDRIVRAIESIRNLEMLGGNLSMPNKMAAIPLMDELSEAAEIVGAINTIVNTEGKLKGHITDGKGFMRSLVELDLQMKNQKMTLIGAGGAATAIMVQAAFDGVREIAVYNQRDDFYEKINDKISLVNARTNCFVHLEDLEDEQTFQQDVRESILLVNATSVGMSPNTGMTPITNFEVIRPELTVVDVIYTPRETLFLKEAAKRGATTANGLGMQLYQAAENFKLWTGKEMPLDEVRDLLNR
ncbi:shikimate dehydrogenase [Enterococcus malodoratus]|uniref:shikimate dehydrogenase n=1 Tax=Enterococcus malodoratus TaxID=71451 RepID=UPI0039AF1492